ncbi:MAG: NADP-dependent oxidoreductase [Betaproteobacteria bacterium]|jgi:NADPH-dependent curcumin reductase CurA
MEKNQQILLAARPQAQVELSHFKWVEKDIEPPGESEFLVRAHYLSLDPYMRGRIDEAKSYAAKVELGAVMVGTVVGEVIVSHHEKFPVGSFVETHTGWQLYGKSNGAGVRLLPPKPVPLSAYLGAVGMPGVTAWIGLNEHGRAEPGQTVVISAASGAVGSVAGQLAKLKGCRVVGIAGGQAKCDYVVNELGFDACIDYKKNEALTLSERLAVACPKGVDVYFDNVGGPILNAVLEVMNPFSRIALCGLIAGYEDPQRLAVTNFRSFLVNRIQLRGFICSDHRPLWKPALEALAQGVASGAIRYRETVAQGLQAAPGAFIGMLRGENFGKQLVKLI